ncbi:protein suppressor of variegation 3-7 [Drosophila eugracilis]|uniref:protein suppressor of variegation 3-7 n=1 Tax=Drosophila eugracilis TaxID=29029 RepID=UPI001BDA2BF5|nr:protein suppressor of variegation 3-7 [Drosophila eugracilis]
MSFSENTSDLEWKARKINKSTSKREEEQRCSSRTLKPKYNQKFCEKWLKIFDPWLRRAAEDPNKPFCRACQCTMDCNRCHLVRHERTTKHKRNLEALLTKGEGAALQEFRIRQQRSKYYHQRKLAMRQEEDEDPTTENVNLEPPTRTLGDSVPMTIISVSNSCSTVIEEVTVPKQELLSEAEATTKIAESSPSLPRRSESSSATSNQDGLKLLMQIHQDKNDLMDSFRELMGSQRLHTPPPKEKNHVDLFFESVSSSVKALSPKLVAEAKMRVSQLICELELRGLREKIPTETINQNPLTSRSHVLRPPGHCSPAVAEQSGFSGIS